MSTLLEDTAPTALEKIRIYAGNGMPEGVGENSGTDSHFPRRKMVSGPGLLLVVALKEMVLDPRGRAAVAKAG